MNAGRKIAEGSAATVLSDAEVIRAYLGEADV
jgi:ABC-type branched-subunit amino acid transport system ATPase component